MREEFRNIGRATIGGGLIGWALAWAFLESTPEVWALVIAFCAGIGFIVTLVGEWIAASTNKRSEQ